MFEQLTMFDVKIPTTGEAEKREETGVSDITLHHGDCYEVIKDIPDDSIDLVIIDPPYEFIDAAGAGGSGTTGVACRKTNRKFIGIEVNDEYFEIAKERINKEKPYE